MPQTEWSIPSEKVRRTTYILTPDEPHKAISWLRAARKANLIRGNEHIVNDFDIINFGITQNFVSIEVCHRPSMTRAYLTVNRNKGFAQK